ncbi:MAG: acetyltransferase [Oscillospiraceae bacterium]|nr:acetyltransferase [Oscillospiraceae bacterium]
MANRYSPSEFIKNCWSLFCTKLFFRPARLVRRPVYIRGKKGMTFGPGFTTGYRCRFEMLGNSPALKLGSNCKLGDAVHIVASEAVSIGDDCLFASHIFISDTNHGTLQDDPMTPPDSRVLTCQPVSIGHRVWLGEGAAVLPGAKIGDGCIIGAHAVVKGEIPPYTIAVGSPAKPVKKYNFATRIWERC